MQKQIVIAQRGWVWVGDVSETETLVTIANAQNIRRWGTTSGLGQLAIEGPQQNTILDPSGTVTIHPLAIVARLNCDEAKWNSNDTKS